MCTKKIPIAIQLYSLRDVIANDVAGTFAAIAEMGYDGVEFAGCYGYSGNALRALLDANGLRCAGSHVGLPLLEGEALPETIAIHQALGTDRLIVPGAPLDDLDDTIRRLNTVHAAAREQGMRVGYHNHKQEFQTRNGRTAFERIFDETPADFLVQVDIGWAVAADQDATTWLRRYAHRIETVHVKEYKPDDPTAAVGQGIIDWAAMLELLEQETATQWYVVEQEKFRVGPLESARECLLHLRKINR